MSDFLSQNNILVQNGYAAKNLDPSPDLVVIGNALSRGNSEIEAILERKLPYISMAELLKKYFKQYVKEAPKQVDLKLPTLELPKLK